MGRIVNHSRAGVIRRGVLGGVIHSLAVCLALGAGLARSEPSVPWLPVPEAKNLSQDGTEAGNAGVPVVLFFSRASCAYCARVERHYLGPLSAQAAEVGVFVRKVELDGKRMFSDFTGECLSARDFARRYRVGVVPDVRFVDGAGNEIAPPIQGLVIADFYAGLLDDSIRRARERLAPMPVIEPPGTMLTPQSLR